MGSETAERAKAGGAREGCFRRASRRMFANGRMAGEAHSHRWAVQTCYLWAPTVRIELTT